MLSRRWEYGHQRPTDAIAAGLFYRDRLMPGHLR